MWIRRKWAEFSRADQAAIGNLLLGLNIIVSVGALIALISTLSATNYATETASRAWIVPEKANIVSFDQDAGIDLKTTFINAGKVPAQELEYAIIKFDLADITPDHVVLMNVINKCKDTGPLPRGSVSYPDIEMDMEWGDSTDPTSPAPATRAVDVAAVASGKQALVAQGCVAYVSFGRRRDTQFCWYIARGLKPDEKFVVLRCTEGNNAS